MSEIKVSVIIPVYNVEAYIRECLDSLINQTLEDIEIICINDGSRDLSPQILDEYEKKDSRIKVIHQKNQKQGAARNRGIEIAKGKYIAFIDSDDWVEDNYLEELYNACEENQVNSAVASILRVKGNYSRWALHLTSKSIYHGTNEIIKGIKKNLQTPAKFYKTENIKHLRFQEQVFYEDAPFILKGFHSAQSLITVPTTTYYYRSNPNSTIKSKLDIKHENDKIETALDLITFADNNNIDIGDWAIIKEDHFLWKIKRYKDKIEYFLFGLKFATKKEKYNKEKLFLVFNTACFGDVLLCNPLCQNIKKAFPYSKIIFIVDKKFKDVALYQDCVDEVVVFDKKDKHKGLLGLLRFLKEFKNKKIFASIITYTNERNYCIAKLLKSRFVFMGTRDKSNISTQLKHINLISSLTNRNLENLPMKYNLPCNIENKVSEDKYVVLCPTSKRKGKDMPIELAKALITKINEKTSLKVVYVGMGDAAKIYAIELEKAGLSFINLVNKTTILELGAVLKKAVANISVDTGTLHFGCSLAVPTIALFFEDDHVDIWSPSSEIYNAKTISKNHSAENIFNALLEKVNLNENKVYTKCD